MPQEPATAGESRASDLPRRYREDLAARGWQAD